ncbi:MAG: hypothetical protein LBC92_01125 [Rickettsiales bacterium]|jgi:chromosome segregation ATPase|nr:hypothetical protein [Rickettsiales bacterium]
MSEIENKKNELMEELKKLRDIAKEKLEFNKIDNNKKSIEIIELKREFGEAMLELKNIVDAIS